MLQVIDEATGNTTLQVTSVDNSSSGIYICRAKNQIGQAEDFITLDVGHPPVIVPMPNSKFLKF